MKKSSRIFIAVAAVLLILTSTVPLWRIELSAPQYPEGLVMEIWTFKLGGDVDVVNGLNHYIGMGTMHTDDFIEFKILPYLIWFTVFMGLITALIGKKKLLYFYASWVILFGIVAMADFYKWEYDYGHNLNPNAPIQVPGMTYQPPFIGYKQLLNFGAFSIPDIGGFIFIFNALVVTIVTFLAWKQKPNNSAIKTAVMIAGFTILFSGCSKGPKQINYGTDHCNFCKMTIIDKRFGGEVISKTGKVFKFDDTKCVIEFKNKGYIEENKIESVYLIDYYTGTFFEITENSNLLKSDRLKSPMSSNYAAFRDTISLKKAVRENGGQSYTWKDISKIPDSEALIEL